MKRQTVILVLGTAILAMAGFSAIRSAAAPRSLSPSVSGAASLEMTGTDGLPGKWRTRRDRSGHHSFQQRAVEIGMMKQTTERDDAMRELARDWAVGDPVAAEHWANQLEEDRAQVLNLVCQTIADRTPVEAIAMAERNRLGEAVVEEIVGRWAGGDFPGASEWVTASTAGDRRDRMLAKLALTRAEVAAEEAATLVSSSMSEGRIQEEAAMSVLHQWLRKDPKAAAAWISTFPESPLKERGVREIEGMREYPGAR